MSKPIAFTIHTKGGGSYQYTGTLESLQRHLAANKEIAVSYSANLEDLGGLE
jgi:hypothetical protein